MQEAWIERDVAQCGYCQPGQIMAAVAVVNRAKAEGREVTEADLDGIRNICRCGTYTRIREAVREGALTDVASHAPAETGREAHHAAEQRHGDDGHGHQGRASRTCRCRRRRGSRARWRGTAGSP